MRVGVIGGGPAGATAAYELARQGVDVDLYEAGECMGGLARSLPLWGQIVDLGPHRFFSKVRRVNALWLDVAGTDYVMVKRTTRIYYNGKFFHYPLRPLNALTELGPIEAARCVASYLREKTIPTATPPHVTFESWVVNRFGRRLYEIFFRTYSEKLWGMPCTELDSDFAAQRIKRLDLLEAVKGAFSSNGETTHRTLVDEFAYPLHGTGMIYNRMAERVQECGGRVHLRKPVHRVLTRDGRACALEFEDGSQREFDHIISSMPISLLVTRLPEVPDDVSRAAGSLRFRNTILVYLKVDREELFLDQWLYIHSADLRMGRITNFQNWAPTLYGDEKGSILALEYWANDDDALWGEDPDYLVRLAEQELRSTGLIGDAPVSDGFVHKIRRCYPVYNAGYKPVLSTVQEYLRGIDGLQAIGRYGAFKYNNQDHSILMGSLAAENIVHGAEHDLWAINTDYDEYQEAALITESGLAPVGPAGPMNQ
jgi:protoporphyrinogen oxidase